MNEITHFVISFNPITLKPNEKTWINTQTLLRAYKIDRFIVPNPNIIIHELKANDNSLIKFYEPYPLSLLRDEFIYWSVPLIPPDHKLSMEIENIHDKELFIKMAVICRMVIKNEF